MPQGFGVTDRPLKSKGKRPAGCGRCGLYKTCHSPKMEASGDGKKGILIIAEAPGYEEDQKGIQLIGNAGRFLEKRLKGIGIDLHKDCRKINAINCRPPENREPTNQEIADCRPRVWEEIERFQPKAILLLGKAALKSFLDHRREKAVESVAPWRGWAIPDRDTGCWVVSTYHPSFVLREEEGSPADTIFTSDLNVLKEKLSEPFPVKKNAGFREEDSIKILTRKEQIYDYLKTILENPPEAFAFDYETTGLKPDREGHEIVCCSICSECEKAVSFLVGNDGITKGYLKRILEDPRSKKIAANFKFENRWSRKILGVSVSNWYWDTMVNAHVLDNRRGITGLKFQAYVRFGIADYDSHIKPFLKGDNRNGANDFNRIHEAPIHDLLLYCGVDSLLEYQLFLIQKKEIKQRGLDRAQQLFHNGLLAFSHMESEGLCVAEEYCKQQDKRLAYRAELIEDRLLEENRIREWEHVYGKKFNLYSDHQLSNMLYKHWGFQTDVKTESGGNSAGEAALERLKKDIPFAPDLVTIRKIKKARSTYLSNILAESVNGVMRPFFDLHIPVSYRSSSSCINFQNLHKRNKEFKRIVRRAILPPKDHIFLEADFGKLEVCIGACYHKDPAMIKEITDPSTDMHRDMAIEGFLLGREEWTKEIRQEIKADFVFAQFYGSYFANCAKELWEQIELQGLQTRQGVPLYDHLKKKGICRYSQFEKHIGKVADRFWNERFPVYTAWKKRQWKSYCRNGYVDLKTGFRCSGLMNDRETSNYPIQGAAFHCLLWCLIEIDKELRLKKYQSKVVFQIHDSVGLVVQPDEYNDVIRLIKEVTEVRLREQWDWIIVPLSIEVEVSPMNESWYHQKEVVETTCGVCGAEWVYPGDNCYECPLCGEKTEIPF